MATDRLESDFLKQLRERAKQKHKSNAVPLRPDMDTSKLVMELQTHQVELEIQNEELRKAQVELEESRSGYTDLFDFAPIGYFVLDEKGLIENVNLTGSALLGVERRRLVKKPLILHIDRNDRDIFYSNQRQVFENGESAACELRLVKKDKVSIHAQLFSEPVKDSGGKIMRCRAAIVDITAHKKNEETLHYAKEGWEQAINAVPNLATTLTDQKRKENSLAFLVQFGCTISGEDFFQSLAKYLAKSLTMDFVCIGRLQEGLLAAQTVAIYYDGKFEDNISYTLKGTPYEEVLAKTICCFPRGVRLMFPKDSVLADVSADSYAGIVLRGSQGQPIGLIAVIGRKPLADPEFATSILRVSAVRAAGELERRQAEEKLKELSEELKRSNKDLEEFAYVASHDLREPLRDISGFVDLLEKKYKDKLDKNALEYIHFASDGAKRMDDLLTGLLRYSRIGTNSKLLTDIPLQAALNIAMANLHAIITESEAQISSEELPTVKADGTQLVQLFQNLIHNAIKFRTDHKPEIHVGCQKQENGWQFFVRDNGIGIAQQFHNRIFMVFQRLHGRGKYPGTGIGLSICKKIVERAGGKIWVESEAGRGSTFYFTIPERGQ